MSTLLDAAKTPRVPLRNRRDVEEILIRWDELFSTHGDLYPYVDMEEDMEALAAIAMEALPE